MRTSMKLTVVMGALAVLCVAGQASYGQYSPGWAVHPGPMYGPASPRVTMASQEADENFRITVVQDTEAVEEPPVPEMMDGAIQGAQKECLQKSCDVKGCG